MRTALPLTLFLTCMSASWAQAQTPAQPSGMDEKSTPAAGGKTPRPDKRIENLHFEDAGSRIDEVREGGETKSITVQPKGGMPEYKVVPSDASRSPSTGDRDNAGGSRGWKILGF